MYLVCEVKLTRLENHWVLLEGAAVFTCCDPIGEPLCVAWRCCSIYLLWPDWRTTVCCLKVLLYLLVVTRLENHCLLLEGAAVFTCCDPIGEPLCVTWRCCSIYLLWPVWRTTVCYLKVLQYLLVVTRLENHCVLLEGAAVFTCCDPIGEPLCVAWRCCSIYFCDPIGEPLCCLKVLQYLLVVTRLENHCVAWRCCSIYLFWPDWRTTVCCLKVLQYLFFMTRLENHCVLLEGAAVFTCCVQIGEPLCVAWRCCCIYLLRPNWRTTVCCLKVLLYLLVVSRLENHCVLLEGAAVFTCWGQIGEPLCVAWRCCCIYLLCPDWRTTVCCLKVLLYLFTCCVQIGEPLCCLKVLQYLLVLTRLENHCVLLEGAAVFIFHDQIGEPLCVAWRCCCIYLLCPDWRTTVLLEGAAVFTCSDQIGEPLCVAWRCCSIYFSWPDWRTTVCCLKVLLYLLVVSRLENHCVLLEGAAVFTCWGQIGEPLCVAWRCCSIYLLWPWRTTVCYLKVLQYLLVVSRLENHCVLLEGAAVYTCCDPVGEPLCVTWRCCSIYLCPNWRTTVCCLKVLQYLLLWPDWRTTVLLEGVAVFTCCDQIGEPLCCLKVLQYLLVLTRLENHCVAWRCCSIYLFWPDWRTTVLLEGAAIFTCSDQIEEPLCVAWRCCSIYLFWPDWRTTVLLEGVAVFTCCVQIGEPLFVAWRCCCIYLLRPNWRTTVCCLKVLLYLLVEAKLENHCVLLEGAAVFTCCVQIGEPLCVAWRCCCIYLLRPNWITTVCCLKVLLYLLVEAKLENHCVLLEGAAVFTCCVQIGEPLCVAWRCCCIYLLRPNWRTTVCCLKVLLYLLVVSRLENHCVLLEGAAVFTCCVQIGEPLCVAWRCCCIYLLCPDWRTTVCCLKVLLYLLVEAKLDNHCVLLEGAAVFTCWGQIGEPLCVAWRCCCIYLLCPDWRTTVCCLKVLLYLLVVSRLENHCVLLEGAAVFTCCVQIGEPLCVAWRCCCIYLLCPDWRTTVCCLKVLLYLLVEAKLDNHCVLLEGAAVFTCWGQIGEPLCVAWRCCCIYLLCPDWRTTVCCLKVLLYLLVVSRLENHCVLLEGAAVFTCCVQIGEPLCVAWRCCCIYLFWPDWRTTVCCLKVLQYLLVLTRLENHCVAWRCCSIYLLCPDWRTTVCCLKVLLYLLVEAKLENHCVLLEGAAVFTCWGQIGEPLCVAWRCCCIYLLCPDWRTTVCCLKVLLYLLVEAKLDNHCVLLEGAAVFTCWGQIGEPLCVAWRCCCIYLLCPDWRTTVCCLKVLLYLLVETKLENHCVLLEGAAVFTCCVQIGEPLCVAWRCCCIYLLCPDWRTTVCCLKVLLYLLVVSRLENHCVLLEGAAVFTCCVQIGEPLCVAWRCCCIYLLRPNWITTVCCLKVLLYLLVEAKLENHCVLLEGAAVFTCCVQIGEPLCVAWRCCCIYLLRPNWRTTVCCLKVLLYLLVVSRLENHCVLLEGAAVFTCCVQIGEPLCVAWRCCCIYLLRPNWRTTVCCLKVLLYLLVDARLEKCCILLTGAALCWDRLRHRGRQWRHSLRARIPLSPRRCHGAPLRSRRYNRDR